MKPAVTFTAELDLVEVLKSVRSYDSALWLFVDCGENTVGAVICKVLEYPTGYKVFLVLAGASGGTRISRGNFRAILDHLEIVADKSGCDAIRICGREGWGRIFPEFTRVSSTFDKVIKKGH